MTTVINSAIWLKRLGLIAFSIITLSIAMKVIEEWQYSEIFELTASSSDSQQLCGIRPGKRTFEFPALTYVFIE